MFEVQRIIASLFEIPGLYITLLVVGILLLRKRPRAGKIGWLLFFLLLYGSSTLFFARWLAQPLQKHGLPVGLSHAKGAANSVIVILSGGSSRGIPAGVAGDIGCELSGQSLKRIYHGFLVYKKLRLPLWLSGGNPGNGVGPSEAELMQQALIAFGVPSEQIHVETQSRSTKENAQFTLKKLAPQVTRIFLVTSAVHIPRAYQLFQQTSQQMGRQISIIALPCDYVPEPQKIRWQDFLPSAGALNISIRAVHEYLGLLFCRFAI